MHNDTAGPSTASTTERRILQPYPHVAGCPACREYADDRITLVPATELIVAVLAHHDSSHRNDPLVLASQHFA